MTNQWWDIAFLFHSWAWGHSVNREDPGFHLWRLAVQDGRGLELRTDAEQSLILSSGEWWGKSARMFCSVQADLWGFGKEDTPVSQGADHPSSLTAAGYCRPLLPPACSGRGGWGIALNDSAKAHYLHWEPSVLCSSSLLRAVKWMNELKATETFVLASLTNLWKKGEEDRSKEVGLQVGLALVSTQGKPCFLRYYPVRCLILVPYPLSFSLFVPVK